MIQQNHYEVIIIGGSYSGLSAAMSLGRALRKVLVMDSGLPCNRQTPHSHNFITQDGEKPTVITAKAKLQVHLYQSVEFYQGLAIKANQTAEGFEVLTASGAVFSARKLLFATGIKDLLPEIPGFSDCWGSSIIHCPYCHGYEVKGVKTAVVGNGDAGFEYVKMIANWTKELSLCTNGKSTMTAEQTAILNKHQISIVEDEIVAFEHNSGNVEHIIFKDQSKLDVKALYCKPSFEQHCPLPISLGCELTEAGLLQVNTLQQTNIAGVFASGDCVIQARSVAMAVSSGSFAGAAINKELIDESFV